MSDRASAGIFSAIFEYLAVDPTPRAIEFAGELWRRSWDYDFSYSQLGCDGALIALGLAKAITDDDGDHVIYIGGDHEDAS